MLIEHDGQWTGGISGGCLEGDLMRKTKLLMAEGKTAVVTYDTREDDQNQIGVGLGCQGLIDILVAPLNPQMPHHPILQLQVANTARQTQLYLTVIKNDSDVSIPEASLLPYQIKNHLLEDLKTKFPNLEAASKEHDLSEKSSIQTFIGKQQEKISLFMESIKPRTHLVICGYQYDVFSLVQLATQLDWKITIVAPALKIPKSLHKLAQVIPEDQLSQIQTDPYTAFVLMAHDFDRDLAAFRIAIQKPSGYIGLLGPLKRAQKIFTAAGYPEEHERGKKVFAPTGLDIGSTGPETIALSILSEIQAVFNRRPGHSLRDRRGPIN